MIQSLFFADGGLLALGCNLFNMGLIPAFIAYPLIYRPLAERGKSIQFPSVFAGIVALQLGALCVVAQTTMSGISQLPYNTFLLLMSPIHLAIGLVEGIVTAAIVLFVRRVRPTEFSEQDESPKQRGLLLALFLSAAIVLGAGLSRFASSQPDGLEWSTAAGAPFRREFSASGYAFLAAANGPSP